MALLVAKPCANHLCVREKMKTFRSLRLHRCILNSSSKQLCVKFHQCTKGCESFLVHMTAAAFRSKISSSPNLHATGLIKCLCFHNPVSRLTRSLLENNSHLLKNMNVCQLDFVCLIQCIWTYRFNRYSISW